MLLPAVTLAKIVCFIVLPMCSYPNYIVAEIKMKFFYNVALQKFEKPLKYLEVSNLQTLQNLVHNNGLAT